MTNPDKQYKLLEALGDSVARYVEENSPTTFAFQPYGLTIEICGTENLATMKVSWDSAQYDSLQLRL